LTIVGFYWSLHRCECRAMELFTRWRYCTTIALPISNKARSFSI